MAKSWSELDERGPDHPPFQVAVVADEEGDRALLSTAIAHADQFVAVSTALDDAQTWLTGHPVDAIVGYVDSPDQWSRFRALAAKFPETVSLLLLTDPESFDVVADGNVLNAVVTASREELVEQAAELALKAAQEHELPSPSVVTPDDFDRRRLEMLTPRELEILVLTADGLAIKEIAQRIHRAYATVATHRIAIMEKLGLHDRVALTRFAIRCGLIEA